jgi:GT2 family glycosyltransferase
MSCVVSAVVVAYGEEEQLAAALASVDRALAAVAGETELVIVLNRGIDVTRYALRDGWVVVRPRRNLGFAGGVGAGLARARGEWIAVVNDDCVVEERAIAELLAAAAARPRVGAVAARVLFADRDVVNSAGLEVDRLGVASERLVGVPAEAAGTAADVFGASAAAALYRRTMLDELGGFDETFFAYLEDADLAWRARMRSWDTAYAPAAIVRHRHSRSLGHRSSEKYFLVGRNRVRMLAKNATRSQLRRLGLAMVAYDLAYVAYVAARRRTLAPLRGRLAGLREWRTYRRAGEAERRPVVLSPSRGLRGALRRERAYEQAGS